MDLLFADGTAASGRTDHYVDAVIIAVGRENACEDGVAVAKLFELGKCEQPSDARLRSVPHSYGGWI